jgi:hypothetical protein
MVADSSLMFRGRGICEEWSLHVIATSTNATANVLVLAKHIDPKHNTTVLYEDLANAIDGGANANATQVKNSLLGCGNHGGSVAVTADLTRPEYNGTTFASTDSITTGIIVKLVGTTQAGN